jgi:uncharacterized protein (UPF0216 family)
MKSNQEILEARIIDLNEKERKTLQELLKKQGVTLIILDPK